MSPLPEDSDSDSDSDGDPDRDDRPRPTTPSPPDEEESDPGDLSGEIPPDEDGDLLDDRAQDETLSPTELGIEDGAEEDGWTHESEGDENGHPEDVGDLGGEYGWTSDAEAPGTDDWGEDLDGGLPDQPSALDDTGEEGSGEETDLSSLAFEPLEHEDDEEGDGTSDDEGGASPGSDDRAQLPPKHDEAHILLRAVGPDEGTLATIVARAGAGLLAGGVGLYSADESGALAPVDEGPVEFEEITSIAVDPEAPDCGAVGTMLAGVFTSVDAARAHGRRRPVAQRRPRRDLDGGRAPRPGDRPRRDADRTPGGAVRERRGSSDRAVCRRRPFGAPWPGAT